MERTFSLLGEEGEAIALSDTMLDGALDEIDREFGACYKVGIAAAYGVLLRVGYLRCCAFAPSRGLVMGGGVAKAFLCALRLRAKSQERACFFGFEVGEGDLGSPSCGVQGDALLLS